MRDLIAHAQRQHGDRLPRPRGHLDRAVPARVERALELGHHRQLLGVNLGIREEHAQALEVEVHDGASARAGVEE